ncbi:hypothetical protein [Paucibacter sp. Y2R2-4]|uniref:hypothetical protein n=1 Tax=Paucibacter sp. Y2R2-4 TaxID=2893553 RepID=UPI0021E47E49|nr:hypothetical protein [Paucibacter sp. Y2R2-4]MCV2348243.1 hypothetical protein [Paucibacter sp. Y2R2-4]
MNRFSALALACTLAFTASLPLSAQAQGVTTNTVSAKTDGARMKGAEIEYRARVVELDAGNRLLTLRGPKGRLSTVKVPAEMQNFEKVRVGDDLVIRYATAIAAAMEPTSKSGIRERVESSSEGRVESGGMPAVAAGHTVEVLAVITALDPKANTATLRGVKRTETLAVPANVDINKLKVGDEVRLAMVEAMAISIEHAPAAKAAASKPAAPKAAKPAASAASK